MIHFIEVFGKFWRVEFGRRTAATRDEAREHMLTTGHLAIGVNDIIADLFPVVDPVVLYRGRVVGVNGREALAHVEFVLEYLRESLDNEARRLGLAISPDTVRLRADGHASETVSLRMSGIAR